MTYQNLIDLSSALMTPVIAAIALYIAYRQWQTSRQKLRLEQYDRRLRIYEEVTKTILIVIREADIDFNELIRFRTAVSEADFLFGPEIPKYIDEIYQRGVKLRNWNERYRDYSQPNPPSYDHATVVDEMHKELDWLTGQIELAKTKFKPYLDITR